MSNIGNGNKGRFSERLKQMRYNRLYRKKKINLEDGEIAYKNFLKVVSVIPFMVTNNLLDKPSSNNKKNEINEKKYIAADDKSNFKKQDIIRQETKNDALQRKRINLKKVEGIDVSLIKKKQAERFKNNKLRLKNPFKETIKRNNKEFDKKQLNNELSVKLDVNKEKNIKSENNILTHEKAKELEKKIINLVKKDLVKMINELEIYESELYILSEINDDEKTLDECKKNIEEVKKILAKIEEFKNKYNYLRDNYDFEYLLDAGNETLIDKIIELRNMFGNAEVRATVDDYKLLEAYKYLYSKLDEVHENTQKVKEEKEKQEEELEKRDIDFKKLKEDVFGIDRTNESYKHFLDAQDSIMYELSDKISKIDSREVVDYKLKGYGKYLLNSIKYMGLLMLSPLRGLFPSIATQTIITANTVGNLRKAVVFEKNTQMVYNAIDYSSTIRYALKDLNFTGNLIDDTLENLAKLKKDYNDKFKQYQGDFLEYEQTINKINKLQSNMINNKIKVEIMKNRMKIYENKNEDKIQLVKQLNAKEAKKNK